MNTAILAISVLGILGAFATAMWFIGKMDGAEDRGEQRVRDAITQEAINAKKREAQDFAAPARTKRDIVDSLRKREG